MGLVKNIDRKIKSRVKEYKTERKIYQDAYRDAYRNAKLKHMAKAGAIAGKRAAYGKKETGTGMQILKNIEGAFAEDFGMSKPRKKKKDVIDDFKF